MGTRLNPAWLPRQHGAWPMLLVPLAFGAFAAGPRPMHALLLMFWLTGYFAFNALAVWLKAKRRRKFLTPVVAYTTLSGLFGVALAILAPGVLWWAAVFVPVLGLGLWSAATGRERSVVNGVATCLAASLITLVAFDVGGGTAWAPMLAIAGHIAGYFVGTVLAVKSMIRKRGDASFYRASVAYHLAATGAAVAAWLTGYGSAGLVAVTAAIAARSAVLPRVAARYALRPKHIGLIELGLTALLCAAAWQFWVTVA